jgi:hypothetical protein
LRVAGGGFAVIGDGIKQAGLTHAFAFVIGHDAAGGLGTLETDMNGAIGQMPRRFPTKRFEGEGVIGADMT